MRADFRFSIWPESEEAIQKTEITPGNFTFANFNEFEQMDSRPYAKEGTDSGAFMIISKESRQESIFRGVGICSRPSRYLGLRKALLTMQRLRAISNSTFPIRLGAEINWNI